VILSWRSTAAKMKLAGGAGGGGWGSIKKAVDMHREIKHRKKLKWARLMDDMMLMVRQEREGQPSTLTAQILSEADDPDDEESEDRAQAEQDKAAALKLIGEGGVDFTRSRLSCGGCRGSCQSSHVRRSRRQDGRS
jgi:hypothetical protein